jgi:UDP-4-amino-4,6-dideoxy-N-acetyl-beta-L-altrosamine N-acetyltransferase
METKLAPTWRPLNADDSGTVFAWRNSPHVAEFQYSDHRIGWQEHSEWLAKTLKSHDRKYWIVELDQPAGLCGLVNIDLKHKKGLFVLYIGNQNHIGKGLGSWMTQQVLHEAFEVLKLNKVWVEVMANNEAGIRLYKRNWFQEEGTLRDHVFKNGKPYDVIFMAITKAQYDFSKLKQGY